MRLLFSLAISTFLTLLLLPTPLALGEPIPDANDTSGALHYALTPTPSPVRVDGTLNEPAWQVATAIPLRYEWMPGDGVTPPVATTCLVTFDDQYLYVAFNAEDPDPQAIRAHLMDRDAIETLAQDDHVTIMIDSFNDERRGFQFRVNPLGVQADAMFSELENQEDFSWNATWDAAGQITAAGYVVELAIPFNQLRFPNTAEVQTWGFSAERSYPRSERHRIASYYRDRNRSCMLCQFNKLTGLANLPTGHNLEVAPTFTASRTDRRKERSQGSLDAGSIVPQPGVTARWSPAPNTVINGTINPDFSQVEADAAQLEANNRFALFYPERRPFFLEGLDVFQTPLRAVFTRTVADPIGGVKTTSTVGRNTVGIFATRDRVNNLLLPSNQGSGSTQLEQDVSGGVMRFRRDVGAGSSVGALYAGRAATGYHNHVAGADGFVRLSRANTLSFQYLRSATHYPGSVAAGFAQPEDAFGGDALSAVLSHRTRRWSAFARYEGLSPTLRDDSGFFPRVDTRTGELQAIRAIWGDNHAWFSSISLGVNAKRTYRYNGALTDQHLIFLTTYRGPLQSVFHLQLNLKKDRFAETVYSRTSLISMARVQPTGALGLEILSLAGDEVDFANQRLGSYFRIDPKLTWKLGRRVSLSANYSMQQLHADGARVFTERLVQTRLLYHFSVRAFVRATMQYRSVDRNVANYTTPVDARMTKVFRQLLFSYTLNPQSVVFIGYSDNMRGSDDFGLIQMDRSYFLKLGYAWTL
ncbi:MAG: hypothetical protein GVY12_01870 [Bacteroidetes bacterium]|jgi:hypothetical protein|nr:hypothetical protein [Bacteroidota bacterium]